MFRPRSADDDVLSLPTSHAKVDQRARSSARTAARATRRVGGAGRTARGAGERRRLRGRLRQRGLLRVGQTNRPSLDVSPRLDAREAANGRDLAGAELADMIVSDLRGPLTTIAGWARLLRDGQVPDDEERQQALVWIEQSAAAQNLVLDDLAELAELYTGTGAPLSVEKLDLFERARAGDRERPAPLCRAR